MMRPTAAPDGPTSVAAIRPWQAFSAARRTAAGFRQHDAALPGGVVSATVDFLLGSGWRSGTASVVLYRQWPRWAWRTVAVAFPVVSLGIPILLVLGGPVGISRLTGTGLVCIEAIALVLFISGLFRGWPKTPPLPAGALVAVALSDGGRPGSAAPLIRAILLYADEHRWRLAVHADQKRLVRAYQRHGFVLSQQRGPRRLMIREPRRRR